MRHLIRSLGVVLVLCLCWQQAGFALTNEEVFSQFQFNFITPGARANALGGAFIGLADDATAVESNPPGLTQLYDAEVSVELKHIGYITDQIYENLEYDTDITRRDFDNSVNSLAFASVAFPYKKFVFSLYRQELVNYESSFQTSQYPIRYVYPGGRGVIYPIEASSNLNITNYGIGLAFRPLEGVSVALSPRWSEMQLTSSSIRFRPETFDIFDFPEPTDFSEDDVFNETSIDDSDANLSFNAGLLWRLQWLEEMLNFPRVSIGAVYRSGAKFEITERFITPVFIEDEPWETVSDLSKFTLKVPDSFGIGIGIRPSEDLTLTLDVVHIQYEDLLEDFDIVISPDDVSKDDYAVDNVTEIHLGAEYVFDLGERFLALRAGAYTDPDHMIKYVGPPSEVDEALFPGGDDQIHITGGVGLVVNEHFQIDTAANISSKSKQLSISGVYRF